MAWRWLDHHGESADRRGIMVSSYGAQATAKAVLPRLILVVVIYLGVACEPGKETPTVLEPTLTPTPSLTATVTDTPTLTPSLTDTPTLWIIIVTATPTFTPTPLPPTATPTSPPQTATAIAITPPPTDTPTPESTRPQYQYSPVHPLECLPNCGSTGFRGTIYDVNAKPVDGLRVKVWAEAWEGAFSMETYDGAWEILMAPGPRGGSWYVAVYSGDADAQLSEPIMVHTDWEPCAPTSGGCQWATIDFRANW